MAFIQLEKTAVCLVFAQKNAVFNQLIYVALKNARFFADQTGDLSEKITFFRMIKKKFKNYGLIFSKIDRHILMYA